jgi:branched-chain amino acid transport system substrate-binding protein
MSRVGFSDPLPTSLRRVRPWRASLAIAAAAVVLAACGSSGGSTSAGSQAAACRVADAGYNGGAANKAAADKAGAPSKYVIFNITPYSGPAAIFGTYQDDAAKIFLNAVCGQVNGRPVEYVPVDNQNLASQTITAYQRAVQKYGKPSLVICGNSASILVLLPLLKPQGIALFNTATGADSLVGASPLLFNLATTASKEAAIVAKYAYDHGIRTAAGDYVDDAFGEDSWRDFSAAFEAAGGKTVGSENIPVDETNFSAPASALAAKKPDAIFSALAGGADAVFIKQARQAGYNGTFVGTSSLEVASTLQDGQAAQGTIMTAFFPSPSSSEYAKYFVDQYEASHKGAEPNLYNGLQYDGLVAWAQATEQLAKDGKAYSGANLIKEFESVGSFQTVFGTKFTVNSNKTITGSIDIVKVVNGNYEILVRNAQ